MIKALFAAVVLFSSTAFACPDLSGSYSCDYNGEITNLELRQSEKNGVTTFTGNNGEKLIADGKIRKMPDQRDFKKGTIQAFCDDHSLFMVIKGDIYISGKKAGQLAAHNAMALDADSNLAQTTHVEGVINGKPVTQEQNSLCTRL